MGTRWNIGYSERHSHIGYSGYMDTKRDIGHIELKGYMGTVGCMFIVTVTDISNSGYVGYN